MTPIIQNIPFTQVFIYDTITAKGWKQMTKKRLKERIIDAALILFEEKGYHGVTVEQIVDRCHTSKGGFYHNFKSKDELLYSIHDIFISYVLDKAKEAYDKYETPISRMYAIIHSFTKVFDMYKPHITVFYQESTYLKSEFQEAINKKRDQYRDIIYQVIKEGQETGDFRNEVPPDIATMGLIGMINWTYKWFKQDGSLTIEEIAHIFTDLILHSLLTEDALKDFQTKTMLLKNQPIHY